MTNSAQGLLLVLQSGNITGSTQGSIWDVSDQTLVHCVHSKGPMC